MFICFPQSTLSIYDIEIQSYRESTNSLLKFIIKRERIQKMIFLCSPVELILFVYSFFACSLNRFAHHLRTFKDVFTFPEDSSYGGNFGCHLALHPLLSTPEDRTKAVADVVKCFADKLIPGIRNEVLVIRRSCVGCLR